VVIVQCMTTIHRYDTPRHVTGILRQSSYTTGFGSALNIETLVAAAERRDTPIEVRFFFMYLKTTLSSRTHNVRPLDI
jgi:hypothetical protein